MARRSGCFQAPASSQALHLGLDSRGQAALPGPHGPRSLAGPTRVPPALMLLSPCLGSAHGVPLRAASPQLCSSSRRFGKYSHDELSILVPLQQCCRCGSAPPRGPHPWAGPVTAQEARGCTAADQAKPSCPHPGSSQSSSQDPAPCHPNSPPCRGRHRSPGLPLCHLSRGSQPSPSFSRWGNRLWG